MENEDFYHLERRVISRNEFFEMPEEEIRQIIKYDLMVNAVKKFTSSRIISIYDYGDNKDIDVPSRIEESEAIVRVGLSRFLRRVLGDLPSYSEGKYRLPIKYKGHQDLFRQEFWIYFENNYKSDFS